MTTTRTEEAEIKLQIQISSTDIGVSIKTSTLPQYSLLSKSQLPATHHQQQQLIKLQNKKTQERKTESNPSSTREKHDK
jgi:hypothetical protein